jgi:hypothetical protein
MQIHHSQEAHGGDFDQSRPRTNGTGHPANGITASVAVKTALQQARLAIITHIFALLSLLCPDPPTSTAGVILSAFKVATTICQRGGWPWRRSHATGERMLR